MMNTILGTKGKMSQTFIEGFRIPVTEVVAGPCVVTQIKKMDKDGYWAVQLGLGERKTKNITKPLLGHLKAAYKENKKAARFLVEVRVSKEPKYNVGDIVTLSDIFKVGDVIAVSGISKAKGFAGVVKRWHFAGGPRTHGQSDRERAPGSIGSTTTPGRVLKGKKMAGRMGKDRTTIKNLHILAVKPEENVLLISGPIPGNTGDLLEIKKLSSGSLEELERETVAQIVEGEAPAGEEKTEGTETPSTPASEAPKAQGGGQSA
jgi:large subunit ribosomal protein L3